MSTHLRDLALAPRAVAVLVCLRKGPRTIRAIADAIADESMLQTRALLALLVDGINGDHTGRKLVRENIGSQRGTYGLSDDGLGWLQSHGLDASQACRDAMYDRTRAASAAEHIREVGRTTLDTTDGGRVRS